MSPVDRQGGEAWKERWCHEHCHSRLATGYGHRDDCPVLLASMKGREDPEVAAALPPARSPIEGGEARSGKHPESVRTGEGETFGERAERLGGEARNHEAEVEAVARAILAANRGIEVPFEEAEEFVREWCRRSAAAAIAALDAVRCAQGECEDCGGVGIRGPDELRCATCDGSGRSPQGEDHEVGLAEFQEGLTSALNRHGVPAMPSWDAAIDWLAEHGSSPVSGTEPDTAKTTISAMRDWAERYHRDTGVYPDWEQIERLFLTGFPVDAGGS